MEDKWIGVGSIAQRLEQGTHNPLVPGSNPGGPTDFRGNRSGSGKFIHQLWTGSYNGEKILEEGDPVWGCYY